MNENRLNGLDLFSGYGGISLALSQYVRPIMYCEIEKYAQGILLSRMDDGTIPVAPIWTDVTSLDGSQFKGLVDIIYGGFPCQDLSTAGKGAGLEGKRSGLFYEIIRLTKEINPAFVFLENVPAIRTRGLLQVISAFREVGYDCRWTCVSASSVGAPHKRERWFLLAHTTSSNDRLSDTRESEGQVQQSRVCTGTRNVAHSMCNGQSASKERQGTNEGDDRDTTRQDWGTITEGRSQDIWRRDTESTGSIPERELPDTESSRIQGLWSSGQQESHPYDGETVSVRNSEILSPTYWEAKSYFHRVVDGPSIGAHRITWMGKGMVDKETGEAVPEEELKLLFRADRIKACGNGVVPLQVKVAFERLIGRHS